MCKQNHTPLTHCMNEPFVYNGFPQGRIEPPKAAREYATSHSPCIDGIVLSVTKNNVSG